MAFKWASARFKYLTIMINYTKRNILQETIILIESHSGGYLLLRDKISIHIIDN